MLDGTAIYFKNISVTPLGAVAHYSQDSISETYWYDKANGNDGAVTGAEVLNYGGAHTDGTDLHVDGNIIGEGGFSISENGNANQLYLATGGHNIMGHNASIQAYAFDQKFQVHGTSAQTSSQLLARWSNDASQPHLVLAKSKGASIGTNGLIVDNTTLGTVSWVGDDGNNLATLGAQIQAKIDGTPAASGGIG